MSESLVFPIEESSQIATVRRASTEAARKASFNAEFLGRTELIVVELAKNILHHAANGTIFINLDPEQQSLKIIAVDKGPGMINIDRCMEDGFSTAGTPGIGLGAIRRLSQKMEIYSQREQGTVVCVSLSMLESLMKHSYGVLCTPIKGELVSGDQWAVAERESRSRLFLADGLGHGSLAAEAAQRAKVLFLEGEDLPLNELMQRMHSSLKSTRGAAISMVEINHQQHSVHMCGIGNVAASIQREFGGQSMVSHNGTVGHQLRKVQIFDYLCQKDDLVIMHSDGVSTHWKLSSYPSLITKDVQAVASILYRDCSRGRDDATILVTRIDS